MELDCGVVLPTNVCISLFLENAISDIYLKAWPTSCTELRRW